jgi:hypothetical protein
MAGAQDRQNCVNLNACLKIVNFIMYIKIYFTFKIFATNKYTNLRVFIKV